MSDGGHLAYFLSMCEVFLTGNPACQLGSSVDLSRIRRHEHHTVGFGKLLAILPVYTVTFHTHTSC